MKEFSELIGTISKNQFEHYCWLGKSCKVVEVDKLRHPIMRLSEEFAKKDARIRELEQKLKENDEK